MRQKSVTMQSAYSKQEIEKIMQVAKKLEVLQKQSGFRKAARDFVKLTT